MVEGHINLGYLTLFVQNKPDGEGLLDRGRSERRNSPPGAVSDDEAAWVRRVQGGVRRWWCARWPMVGLVCGNWRLGLGFATEKF
ncbi:hypothetical protein ES288_A13G132200v1 [Gossypium darwinii]|uniref:Uncharacterized protein n=1 Tax=Gossypium darwinii TaxID=34276 RepID=A0A5D2DZA1_GOSDA|nr:hypothetical protein ES288_A13G132200v1 [Gossypium darwinii]